MTKALFPAAIFLLASAGFAFAEQEVIAQVPSPLSIEVLPSFDLPIADSSQYFSFGGGADLGVKYRVPGTVFTLMGGLSYSFAPVQALTSLSMITPRIGAGVQVPLASWISVYGFAAAGYYFATYNDFSMNDHDPYVAGGLGIKFALAPSFGLEIGARYTNYLALYQGISVAAGVDVALGNLGGSVDIPVLRLRPAFPVFFKHYDDHAIGSLELKSSLKVPATDVKAQLYIKEFMDAPKSVLVCGSLAPGESRKADLFALFTDKVLGVTEGTKVAAEITVSYKVEGQAYQDKKVETLSVLGRNAMTWDDNAKAAAFVTAKEPQVLNFARTVTSSVRARDNRSINENLQAAIALHEALDLFGINYTPNPVTPYSEASRKTEVIDFLQFPRETFQYKAGDCSDISILYCALLQAVGIDAAFITVPGHIFVAVSTGLGIDQAADALIPEGQFIGYRGKIWLPVEITMRHQGFLKAWQLGAKEWSENVLTGAAGFYPIKEAWESYQPVGLPGAETAITVPRSDAVLAAYLQETQKYVESAIGPQIARLQEQVRASGSVAAMNSLGVLYAKYGQTDLAEQAFRQVLAKKTFLPTLLNLGNLCCLKGDWKGARDCYQQAKELVPNNPHVLLALAKVCRELQDYPEMEKNFQRLRAADPALAERFAYLGQGTEGARAADVESERSKVIWEGSE
jgi:tetratricopeptide (TPR) repeat protein